MLRRWWTVVWQGVASEYRQEMTLAMVDAPVATSNHQFGIRANLLGALLLHLLLLLPTRHRMIFFHFKHQRHHQHHGACSQHPRNVTQNLAHAEDRWWKLMRCIFDAGSSLEGDDVFECSNTIQKSLVGNIIVRQLRLHIAHIFQLKTALTLHRTHIVGIFGSQWHFVYLNHFPMIFIFRFRLQFMSLNPCGQSHSLLTSKHTASLRHSSRHSIITYNLNKILLQVLIHCPKSQYLSFSWMKFLKILQSRTIDSLMRYCTEIMRIMKWNVRSGRRLNFLSNFETLITVSLI